MSWDPYLDLDAGVLRNRLGIVDPVKLAQAEANFTSVRIAQLRRRPLPGRYNLVHLQAFHRHIFSDVYEWAGELRTVSIGTGALFCLPQHLVAVGDEVFGELAHHGHLRNLDRDFLDGVAALAAKLNALHPCREGNGRTQRAFLGQLSRDAAHPIRWSGMDPAVNVAASQAAHRSGDIGPLRLMLDQLVDRPENPLGAAPDRGRG